MLISKRQIYETKIQPVCIQKKKKQQKHTRET